MPPLKKSFVNGKKEGIQIPSTAIYIALQLFITFDHFNNNIFLTSPYFERWINLFDETVDELFEGYKAREIKFKAANIKDVWRFKMDHINSHSQL